MLVSTPLKLKAGDLIGGWGRLGGTEAAEG